MPDGEIIATPRLRQAAIVAIAGSLMSLGVPFAEFRILPSLLVADSASRTAQNVAAHHGAFLVAMFAHSLAFCGDIGVAWAFYLILRPVNAAISMLVAWVRLVFVSLGFAAVLNLVTANRLIVRPSDLAALGQAQLDAQVFVAMGAFRSQFNFCLMLFGVHLALLGWLFWRSTYLPRWLGAVVVVDGLGWILLITGRFVGVNLEFLSVTSLGELVLLVWLIGWGTRLRDPDAARA